MKQSGCSSPPGSEERVQALLTAPGCDGQRSVGTARPGGGDGVGTLLGGSWGQGTASLGCFVHPTGWWRSITRAEPARTVVLLPGEPMLPCQGGFPTSSWEFWRCQQEQWCPVHPRHGQMVRGALCGCPASWSCHISRSIFGSEAPRHLQPAPQPCYTVPSSSSVAEEPPGDFQSPARQDQILALPAGSGDA